ncbi:MAG: 3-phosphoserine/phosphohydroxythreonine transaminase [Candidatus Endonucleobacter bathymodioli]|uniref:Phosphoserine aminotransferase n=1 Tax=Candidatus Endonucleibacter bathymodioli TaxID=539814 RepID=A0AA90NK16_9GAMM|nr:3-phosphoserine/phosphohydroxythreonine transaminase [Candidatus Endonucleobacter bathymodioli]
MSKACDDLLTNAKGRVFNFSSGPAPMPLSVLEQARDELLNWKDSGASVMEVSHRGKAFMQLAEESIEDLRNLLDIPDNYTVLFLQGGARGQFAGVPLNIKGSVTAADYVDSGFWAQSAITEAQRYLTVNVVSDGKKSNFQSLPKQSEWRLNADAAYLHYTPNETIGGLEFPFIPDSGSVPLVADMSSNILSRPLDISRFGIIYAGAQKNIGPAGLTVVIIRNDLMERKHPTCPSILSYKDQSSRNSMYNTPPTFAWYLSSLVFKWLKKSGGLKAIAEINERKANKLYGIIDKTGFYLNNVDKDWRSRMNVPFSIIDSTLDTVFLAKAEQEGFLSLKGHIAAGGMRASIYNAVPESHVDALIGFMTEFERRHG